MPGSQKMTSDQFAEQIKAKYPAYANVDNTTLTQKMLAKYPVYADKVQPASSYDSTDIPYVNGAGVPGSILNAGIGVANTAKNIGVGVGTTIGEAALGVPQALSSVISAGANAVGAPSVGAAFQGEADMFGNLKKEMYQDPFAKDNSTFAGKVGQVGGTAAIFAAPTGAITKAQDVLGAGADALNLGGKVMPWIAQKIAQIAPEAIGTGVTQYGTSGGDTNSALDAAAGAGALSTISHVGMDAFNSLVPQTVKDNVAGFLRYTGKTGLKDVGTAKKINDATSAFTTMIRQAPEIKVTDINGVTKPWNPLKTSIAELPQVLYQAKNNLYKAYTSMATKAGDEGAMFGQKEFLGLKKSLEKFMGAGYTAQESAQAQKWIQAIDRYATKNPVDGSMYFKNTTPDNVQSLLETVNKHADPRVQDTATAVVANDLGTTLRDALDKKIESAAGPGYQQMRTAYSQLKSVEKDIIERAKPALRQTGSLPSDFIDGLASIDILQGLLTGNPGLAVRGGSIATVKAFVKFLRSPDVKMQRALKFLMNGDKASVPGGLSKRFLGTPSSTIAPTLGAAAGAVMGGPVK